MALGTEELKKISNANTAVESVCAVLDGLVSDGTIKYEVCEAAKRQIRGHDSRSGGARVQGGPYSQGDPRLHLGAQGVARDDPRADSPGDPRYGDNLKAAGLESALTSNVNAAGVAGSSAKKSSSTIVSGSK